MADTPKKEKGYKPSPEQIKQLCRSRNMAEAEAWAFLESDTRDAKDMLAYLEYEGCQIPPDEPEAGPESSAKNYGSSDGGAGHDSVPIDWTATRKRKTSTGDGTLSALRDEVDRAGKVMGQAAELLKHRTPKPLSDESGDKTLPHSDDKGHLNWLWAATGVVVTILALVFWGFLFVAAWVLYAVGIYRAPWFSSEEPHVRFAKKAVIDALIALGLLALWWFAPIPDFAKPKEVKTNTATASPTATGSAQLSPSLEPTRSPALASPTAGLSPSPASLRPPAPFSGTVSLRNGERQSIASLLIANGYEGPMVRHHLEICNRGQAEFYVSSQNVKDGFLYEIGDCNSLWDVDATQWFINTEKAGRAGLVFE